MDLTKAQGGIIVATISIGHDHKDFQQIKRRHLRNALIDDKCWYPKQNMMMK